MADRQDRTALGREIAVSVVVPSRLGAGWLPRCLDALVDQDLTDGFEVVVVQYGPDDGTRAAVDQTRDRRPEMALRHVGADVTTRAAAKNLGLAESSGAYVVFVEDEDRVSRRFLSGMLAVRPEGDQIVLPLRLADYGDAPASVRGAGPQRLFTQAGRVVSPRRVAAALAPAAGIAFPRALLTRQGVRCRSRQRRGRGAAGPAAVVDVGVLRDPAGRVRGRVLPRDTSQPRCSPGGGRPPAGWRAAVAELTLPDELEPVRRYLITSAVTDVNRYLQTHPKTTPR